MVLSFMHENPEEQPVINWDAAVEEAEANLPPLGVDDLVEILTAPSASEEPPKPPVKVLASGTVAELADQLRPIFIEQHQHRISTELGDRHILTLQFETKEWEVINLSDLDQWDTFISKWVQLEDDASNQIINSLFDDTKELKYLIMIAFKYPMTIKQLDPSDKYVKIINASLSNAD